METKKNMHLKTVLIVAWLTVAAAASFCSMFFFTRSVFGNDLQWILCFAVLVLSLLLSAAIKKPAICLAVSVAAAAAMQFYTPYYIPMFFPVALQAALWEAARDQSKTGKAIFVVSLLLIPATIPLRLRLNEFLRSNTPVDGSGNSVVLTYLLIAGFALLFALWVALPVRSLQHKKEKKEKKRPSAKKSGRKKPKDTNSIALSAVYFVCAAHTLLAGINGVLHFSGEYIKLLFFANAVFVCYLLYRRDALLCGALRIPTAEGAEQNKQSG